MATTDKVAMESEDLFISRDEVRVSYVFRNLTPQDVEAEVAFPFPDIDVAMSTNVPLKVPGRQGANFLDFSGAVDGRAVTPGLDIQAYLPGPPEKNITTLLTRHKIPLTVFSPGFFELLDTLGPEARRELKAAGAIDVDEFTTAAGPRTNVTALWHVRSAYHWRQVFPAGKPVSVEHRYKPFAGYFWIGPEMDKEMVRDYCIDEGTAKGLRRRLAANPVPEIPGYARATDLAYVLKTANNWAGPIRRFRLTIDKEQPDVILSLCIEGIRKVSPTRFVAEFTDYRPQRDLRLLLAPMAEREDSTR